MDAQDVFQSSFTGNQIQQMLSALWNVFLQGTTGRLFTLAEAIKLSGIETGAQKNPGLATLSSNGLMSSSQVLEMNDNYIRVQNIQKMLQSAIATFNFGPDNILNFKFGELIALISSNEKLIKIEAAKDGLTLGIRLNLNGLGTKLQGLDDDIKQLKDVASIIFYSKFVLDEETKQVTTPNSEAVGELRNAIEAGQQPYIKCSRSGFYLPCQVHSIGSSITMSFEHTSCLYQVVIDHQNNVYTNCFDVYKEHLEVNDRLDSLEQNSEAMVSILQGLIDDNRKTFKYCGSVVNYDALTRLTILTNYLVYRTLDDGTSYYSLLCRSADYYDMAIKVPCDMIMERQTSGGSWISARPIFAVWDVETDSDGLKPHSITAMRADYTANNTWLVFLTTDNQGNIKIVSRGSNKFFGVEFTSTNILNNEVRTTSSVLWNKF